MDDRSINLKLKRNFGELDGKQIFRLARTDQTEYRRGTWVDTTPEGIYLRTVTEVRLTRKYNYIDSNYWVIEKLTPVSGPNAEMLPGRNVSYEPIFVFRKPDGSPMVFGEDTVLSFVHLQLFGERKKRDLVKEELDFYEAQVDRITQFLQDECSPMSMQLHFGEAVVNAKPQGQVNGECNDSVSRAEGNHGIQAGVSSPERSDSSGPVE